MDKNKGLDPEHRLQQLQKELADLKSRWPAHSVKPSLVIQLDELEEEIANLEELLKDK